MHPLVGHPPITLQPLLPQKLPPAPRPTSLSFSGPAVLFRGGDENIIECESFDREWMKCLCLHLLPNLYHREGWLAPRLKAEPGFTSKYTYCATTSPAYLHALHLQFLTRAGTGAPLNFVTLTRYPGHSVPVGMGTTGRANVPEATRVFAPVFCKGKWY